MEWNEFYFIKYSTFTSPPNWGGMQPTFFSSYSIIKCVWISVENLLTHVQNELKSNVYITDFR